MYRSSVGLNSIFHNRRLNTIVFWYRGLREECVWSRKDDEINISESKWSHSWPCSTILSKKGTRLAARGGKTMTRRMIRCQIVAGKWIQHAEAWIESSEMYTKNIQRYICKSKCNDNGERKVYDCEKARGWIGSGWSILSFSVDYYPDSIFIFQIGWLNLSTRRSCKIVRNPCSGQLLWELLWFLNITNERETCLNLRDFRLTKYIHHIQ
jgi:hypothetical protein